METFAISSPSSTYAFAIAILRSFLSNNDVLDLLSISTLDRETVSRSSSCFSFGFFEREKERYKKNCLMELENLDPFEVRKKYLTHRQMSGRLIPGKMESLELCGNWRASR